MNWLFVVLQYLVPQHLLSRLAGKLADSELPWIKNPFINWFRQRYGVDMSEAFDPEPEHYPSFNAFFTRALRPGVRPIDIAPNAIVSPADGVISQLGAIEGDRIFQAKGQHYSARELLGGDAELAALFADGDFATIYLSPRDYHRVHMPVDGKLLRTIYVPGDLFSVNQTTAANVPRLFARNERLVCLFDTPFGPMASVMVGAMIVAGIETVWSGQEAPLQRQVRTARFDRAPAEVALDKGAEMGRFKLGSTVVLLFAKDRMRWRDDLAADLPLKMGERIGQRR
jgi:phosphatidylserine decarboxylase